MSPSEEEQYINKLLSEKEELVSKVSELEARLGESDRRLELIMNKIQDNELSKTHILSLLVNLKQFVNGLWQNIGSV
jgi:hypothetical protein